MLSLPNGCHIGKISVHPKDWDTCTNKPDKDWYIHYRFHHPDYRDKYPKGFLKILKGMNEAKGLTARRNDTRKIIKNEIANLEDGYNPIVNKIVEVVPENEYEIPPSTPFMPALQKAYELLPPTKTKTEIRKSLEYIKTAIDGLSYHKLKICDVRKMHIKAVLGKIGQQKKVASGDEEYEWGASSYNHYRVYLKMLFTQLEEVEATEVDPVSKIKKKKGVRRLRQVLTDIEGNRVDAYLRYFYPSFWRFTHIFFHSGARMAEIMRVRFEEVDLQGQRFKVVIQKGREHIERWKTIKDLAVPFWEELMKEAKPGQYIFSKDLRPGNVPINEHQISRRWRVHVKKDLRISADFYSLKHLNTTQTVDLRGDKAAAAQNSHTSTAMVVNIYDVGRGAREHEELKTVNNPLGGLG